MYQKNLTTPITNSQHANLISVMQHLEVVLLVRSQLLHQGRVLQEADERRC